MSSYLSIGGYFKYDVTSNIAFIRRYQLRKMMNAITMECDITQARCYQMVRQLNNVNIPKCDRGKLINLNQKIVAINCNLDNMNEDAKQGKHKDDFDSFAEDFLASANNFLDLVSDIRRLYVELKNMVYTE